MVLNVGFSVEKFMVGLIFFSFAFSFSSILCSSLSLINDLMSERETGCQKFGFSSFSSSCLVPLPLFFFSFFGALSICKFILGNEKLNEYNIHATARISKMMINALVAIAW